MRALFTLLALLAACSVPPPLNAENPVRNLEPNTALDFVQGPKLDDATALLAALELAKADKLSVRIPVAINVAAGDLGIESAALDCAENPLALTLDDSTLGVSLLDRVSHLCPHEEAPCHVRVEGKWGPAFSFGEPSDALVLTVRDVLPAEPGETHLLVEKKP